MSNKKKMSVETSSATLANGKTASSGASTQTGAKLSVNLTTPTLQTTGANNKSALSPPHSHLAKQTKISSPSSGGKTAVPTAKSEANVNPHEITAVRDDPMFCFCFVY